MTADFDVLARCDALLRMPGESPGADREVAHALKVVGIAGLVVASPIWIFQAWAYIVPALVEKEKRMAPCAAV